MTAALEIEFEAFALEDEHGQPPEEHEGADHGDEGAGGCESGEAGGGVLAGHEGFGAAGALGFAEAVFDGGFRASVVAGNIVGFLGEWIVVGQIPGPCVPGHRVEERATDDDFSVALSFDALG